MDKEKLLKQATAIRDAHMIAENTAVRVGSLFVDIVNALTDGKSFLSRIREDSALKRITFLAGLTMMGGAIASADGSEKIDFEYDTVNNALHFKGNVYADGFITAKGINPDMPGGGSGSSYSRYDGNWSDFVPSMHDEWAVSGKSGMLLHERIKALEDGMPTPHTLTIKRNGTTVGTFDNSADKTVDIADVASATTLSSHMSDTAVHITATERARWNKTASDLSAITGTDADTVINKWEEVVAFLANYTEADTLASLLSHKADKATTLAGYGITDGVNDAKVTGSGNAVTSASVSGHMLTLAKGATFLEKSLFDEMFEKVNTGTSSAPVWAIRAKYAFYSDSWISAKGRNPNMPSGGSGGSGFGLMKSWPSASPGAGTMDALGANLGWELYANKADKTALSSALSRITALEGKNYLDALTLVQSGSGNAVTSVTQSADKKTITVTKGASFLGATATAVDSNALTAINDEHTDLDTLGATANCLRHYYGGGGANNPNKPSGVAQYGLLNMRSASGHVTQLLTSNGVFYSRWYSGSAWQPWRTMLDSGNYASTLDSVYLRRSGGSMTNTSVVTNLNADLLDGYHESSFVRSWWTSNPGFDCDTHQNRPSIGFTYGNNAPFTGGFIDVNCNGYGFYLGTNYGGGYLYYRNHGTSKDGGMGAWQQLARVTDTVANANSLGGLPASAYLKKAGDTMTGPLTIQCGNDAKLIFNNTDGEKYTEISFRENGTEYLSFKGEENRLIVSKHIQAPYFKATSTTLCPNLNADLLDGWHLGDNNGCVARYTNFPGYSALISKGYLDSTYASEGHPDEKYFKALLKWVCATYSGPVMLMGRVAPNSHGFLVLAVYDTASPQNGLPQHSYAVVYRYGGNTVRFGTHSYAWSWNNAVWYGRLAGNATTATKLQTARTLWGQSFDGSANVSGNMTGVGSIGASGEIKTTSENAFRAVQGGYGFFMRNDGTNSFLLLTDKNNADGIWNALRPLTISNATGNVGIGGNALYVSHGSRVGIKTTSPAYDLDVNGSARATSLTLGGGTISWDADAQMFKFSKGLYSEGAVTAKGRSSIPGGGGGSGIGTDSRLDEWADYATDKAGWVLSAKLGWDLNSRLLKVYTKTAVDSLLGAKADSTAVVTALGTSGNSLTWTKNSTVNSITVPYATYSGTVHGSYSGSGGAKNPNAYGSNRVGFHMSNRSVHGNSQYKDWILLDCYSGNDVGGAVAIGINRQSLGAYIMRSNADRATWAEGAELIGTHNYSSILDGRYYTESEINSKLSGYVTLAGAQDITGVKTFTSSMVIKHPDTTGGTAISVYFRDHDGTNKYAFGSLLSNHVAQHAFIGWGDSPWESATCLAVGASVLTYKGNDVLHKGNYASILDSRYYTETEVDAKNFIKDAGDGRTLKFNYSAAALGYDAFTWVAAWNGNTLQSVNKNVFASASALTSGLSGKVSKAGDSMTGALSIKSGAYHKTLELMSTGADSKGKGPGIRFRGSDTDDSQGVILRHEWYDSFVPGYGLAISHEGSLESGDASMWLYNTGRYISKVPTGTKPIDVVSTTLCTNLNADMLDGVHNGSLTAKYLNSLQTGNFDCNAPTHTILRDYGSANRQILNAPAGWTYGCLFTIGAVGGLDNTLSAQFMWDVAHGSKNPGTLWFRTRDSVNGWAKDWGRLAFTTDNVASATKLADDTAFTAWGQKFFDNGKPKNLSGTMTGVGNIYLYSGKYLHAPDANGTQRTLIDFYSGQKPTFAYGFATAGTDVEYCGNNIYLSYGKTHVKGFVLNASGNAGFGKTDPAYRVDVNGDIRMSGQLRLGTWGRMLYDAGGWLQMAPNATNRISAMNGVDMTRLEIKSAVSHFSGQISNSNSAGNGTTIAYGAIELTHATPYIDFHFNRSTEDFTSRIIECAEGVLQIQSKIALGAGVDFPVYWDSANQCWHFTAGIVSDSFITAKAKKKLATGTTTESSDKEAGGILKTASAYDGDDYYDGDEIEQLRQRVAYLEQRLNALTA